MQDASACTTACTNTSDSGADEALDGLVDALLGLTPEARARLATRLLRSAEDQR